MEETDNGHFKEEFMEEIPEFDPETGEEVEPWWERMPRRRVKKG